MVKISNLLQILEYAKINNLPPKNTWKNINEKAGKNLSFNIQKWHKNLLQLPQYKNTLICRLNLLP